MDAIPLVPLRADLVKVEGLDARVGTIDVDGIDCVPGGLTREDMLGICYRTADIDEDSECPTTTTKN